MDSPVNRFVSPQRWTFLRIPPGLSESCSPYPTCWAALHGIGTEAFRLSSHKWDSRGPTSQRSSHNAYGWSPQELKSQTGVLTQLWNQWHQICVMYLPMYPRVPTLPWTSFPSISRTARPRSEIRMWPYRKQQNKEKVQTYRNQPDSLTICYLTQHILFLVLAFYSTDLFLVEVSAHPCMKMIHSFSSCMRGGTRRRAYIFPIFVSYWPLLCLLMFPK